MTGERLPFAGVMPPCGHVHRSCAISCQKGPRAGEPCLGSCELAPYEPGSTIFIPELVMVMPERPPTDEEIGYAELCDAIIQGGRGAIIPPAFIPAVVEAEVVQPKKHINVRAKGQRGEREVVKILQEIVDEVRGRYQFPQLVLQRNALQSHLGGADLHGLEGFAVEVKFVEEPNIKAWWRQATQQAEALSTSTGRDHVPVLFYRSSGIPWTVKFRACVSTPGDRDQIELDVSTDLDEFLDWFTDAYDESLHIGETLSRFK